jgi:hypothetical protein
MLDVLYIGITILFFGLAIAYVAACDRLGAVARTSQPTAGAGS